MKEDILTMDSLKGKTQGEDLYDSCRGLIKKHKLPWCTLANVTTDGSQNLTGKDVDLLKESRRGRKRTTLKIRSFSYTA